MLSRTQRELNIVLEVELTQDGDPHVVGPDVEVHNVFSRDADYTG